MREKTSISIEKKILKKARHHAENLLHISLSRYIENILREKQEK